jgi:uncharacterized protein (DUF934 family)
MRSESHDEYRAHQASYNADPLTLKGRVDGVGRIELHFPHFTDGRAYSQAYLLRRRLGFKGDLRATGDVLIDQLMQMERTGFSSAVLKDGVDPADAQRQFERFPAFYQSDVVYETPVFRCDPGNIIPEKSK